MKTMGDSVDLFGSPSKRVDRRVVSLSHSYLEGNDLFMKSY